MRSLVLTLALVGAVTAAHAQGAIPDLKGTSADNKSIVGADSDGYYRITLLSRDRMEKCYVHNGLSPSGSIVATCHVMERVKK